MSWGKLISFQLENTHEEEEFHWETVKAKAYAPVLWLCFLLKIKKQQNNRKLHTQHTIHNL